MKTKLLSILALLLVAVSGAWAQDTYTVTFKANNKTKTVENVTLPHTFSCDFYNENGELDLIIKELYGFSEGHCDQDASPSSDSENVPCGLNGKNHFITVSAPFDGTATVTGKYTNYNSGDFFTYSLEITCPLPAATYTATMKEGTEDADNWSITPNEGLNENDQVTIKYSGSNMVKSIKVKKVAAPEPEEDFVTFTDGTNTVTVAKMNLGATTVAESPATSYGSYYAWGATTTSTEYLHNAPYFDIDTWGYTKYTSASDATLEAADDAVAANMTGYHMPTRAEMQTLYAACGGTGSYMNLSSISDGAAYAKGIYWVAGGDAAVKIGDDTYSVNGMLFVQDATHHVFFPAAGYVDGTQLSDAGSFGCYWSSSLDTDDNTECAYCLHFFSGFLNPNGSDIRYRGFTVRPVKD